LEFTIYAWNIRSNIQVPLRGRKSTTHLLESSGGLLSEGLKGRKFAATCRVKHRAKRVRHEQKRVKHRAIHKAKRVKHEQKKGEAQGESQGEEGETRAKEGETRVDEDASGYNKPSKPQVEDNPYFPLSLFPCQKFTKAKHGRC
jgi:hypothetical protein